MQKNWKNLEHPISFYIKALRDSTLKYDIMDKQDYALVKALKEFGVYIMHSHPIAFILFATIKDILTQVEFDGRRSKWISTLLDYDIEIRPTKVVKGQCLAKLMSQSNCEVFGVNFFESCA